MKPRQGKQEKHCCRDCAHSFDYHELTAYEPRVPFLCRCPFNQWSQFLDTPQFCNNFKTR